MRTSRLVGAVLLLFCLVLSAARAPIQQGVTSKQIAFRYSRPDTSVCAWEISTDSGFGSLVSDTQGAAGQDSGALGERWFLAGTGTPLVASMTHYWRQTCGAEVYTGQFTTLASVSPDPITSHYSAGGHPYANKAMIEYGTTPALGSAVELPCTPTCSGTVPSARDSFLFTRFSYLNEADVIATGTIRLAVQR